MNTFRLFPFVLPLLLATAPAAAQVDVAALQQRAAATAGEVQQALQRCRKALEAARAAIGDPDNKVQGDCTTIDDVLKGETFDAGIGAIPIALDHLEYVAEDKRTATRAALETLRDELAKGSRLLRAQESLQELASRCEYLAGLGADDDKSLALVDLATSLQKAVLTQAMPKPDLAKVHQYLARARADNDGRLAKELLVQAKTELAQLQQDFAAMKTEMASADAGERDRGFARFDEAARSITTALARVPATDRKGPAAELATMQTTADERYATAFATATAQRMRDNWLFTADQFEAWADEPVVAVTAQGYVDFDPAGVETLCQPRTGALVARANAWFAFAGQDPDYVRCRRTAEVAAFTQSLVEQQAKAHQKLLPVAQAVVDGFVSLEIADERVRGRLQNFADWDLPLLLQNHPAQHAMVDRVHDLLDAHDAKTLGAEAALRLRREQALTAADALWSRMQQWVPLQGGFEPVQAELFVGKLMRLEGVWLRSGEFDAPGHDFAFDLGGRTFVADLTTGLRDALRLARTRLQLGDPQRLAADEACELMAVVGAETEVKLLGGKGKDDALAVPARVVHVIGLRQGAVFAMRP